MNGQRPHTPDPPDQQPASAAADDTPRKGLLIKWTDWSWIDSVVAIAIALWVLPRTWILLKQSLNILLEGVPEGLGLAQLEDEIRGVDGVVNVHDLHVWAISSGKVSLTVHVVTAVPDPQLSNLLRSIRSLLAERFDIHHSTVQLEREPCEQAAEGHGFGPVGDKTAREHAHKH